MASFVQRALMYLGLKDIDDEDEYDSRGRGGHRDGHGPCEAELVPRAGTAAGERRHRAPIARDDGREAPTPVARGAVVRPFVTQRHTKPQVVAPARFSDAQEMATWSRRTRR